MDFITASDEATGTHPSYAKESLVDPFLVEALQNSRHRLTILRMELDIQRFLQNPDHHQFEFQHFPTSYLRLAAHRVAQHYGLITIVVDNGLDGSMNKIVVKKNLECRYPAVRLSEIPAIQSENEKPDYVKIAIRPRPANGSMEDCKGLLMKRNTVRSMEERKEEYDKARARIFSPIQCDEATNDGKTMNPFQEDADIYGNLMESEKLHFRNASSSSSRVAIFRDKEKDLTDPDYDRSYKRYVRSSPQNQSFGMAPFSKAHPPFAPYEASYPQMAPMNGYQQGNAVYSSYNSGLPLRENPYMQWPSASMMYSHSYDQLRHAVFQAPLCQQPLSFDYSQHH